MARRLAMTGSATPKEAVAAALQRLARRAGEPAPGPADVAGALARAVQRLADPDDPLGRRARAHLARSEGLSEAMADLGLRWLAEDADRSALAALGDALHAAPTPDALPVRPRSALVLLARSVLPAPLRPLAEALLAGAPTLVKLPARGGELALLLHEALAAEAPRLAERLEVLRWPGDDPATGLALRAAEVVCAYGSDHTLAALRERLGGGQRLLAHGHGLSVALVWLDALGSERAQRQAVEAVALDVAAFDQRGCLSPHAVLVVAERPEHATRFAERLHEEGLARFASELPRGPLPLQDGAQQLAWRTAAAARGTLLEGDGYAVSAEPDAVIRPSPGYRNVQVVHVPPGDDPVAEVRHRLATLRRHLKCVGVAGPDALRARLATALAAAGFACSVVPAGRMQRPTASDVMDGEPPGAGWLCWTTVG